MADANLQSDGSEGDGMSEDHIGDVNEMVGGEYTAAPRTIENSLWLLFNSLQKFGYKEQVDRCLEEMGELLVALLHRRRGLDDDVVSEVADVIIMSEKMKILFGRNAVDEAISQKLNRLAGMMGEV